jgi:Matrixin
MAALAAGIVGPRPLEAFQRETTNDPPCGERAGVNCPNLGTPLFWPSMPVRYFINSDSSGLSFNTVKGAVDPAFSSWQAASEGGISFEFGGQTHAGADGQDGQNTILWRRLTDSRDVFGQTIITFFTDTGEIIDADTELNASFRWGVLPPGVDDPSNPVVDVQSVVTHEAGHVLGLDHENTLGPQVVMFFSETTGDSMRRMLTADDVAGVRAIYSGGSGGGGGGGGGCALVPSRRGGDLWPVAAVLVLLAGRRRAPRRA